MQVLGPDWDREKLVGGLSDHFRILDCSMKAFPTEALTHTHILVTIKVVTEHDIKLEDIDTVTVTTIARAVDILFDPAKYKPTSRETADHSLPYCIAAAIVDRKITTDQFNEERIKDPRIMSIILVSTQNVGYRCRLFSLNNSHAGRKRFESPLLYYNR